MTDLSGAQAHQNSSSSWSISRSVPLAYIAAIVLQTMTFLVVGTSWVTLTNARLSVLEDFQRQSISIQARMAVLESRDRALETQLTSINLILSKLIERYPSK